MKSSFFTHRDRGFIHYTREDVSDDMLRSLKYEWKAHISVAPEDYERTYDLIMPILTEYASVFKFVDYEDNTRQTVHQQRNLGILNQRHQDFRLFCAGSIGLDNLIDGLEHVYKLTPKQETLYETLKAYLSVLYGLAEKYITDGETPLEQIEQIYLKLIRRAKHLIQSHQRFYNGMQVTVYIEPEFEAHCQEMLEKIERTLLDAGITPGVIHGSDRPLGEYCSIRHPGRDTYHSGLSASSYNPDGVDDPFEHLSTYRPTGPKPK